MISFGNETCAFRARFIETMVRTAKKTLLIPLHKSTFKKQPFFVLWTKRNPQPNFGVTVAVSTSL